MCIKFYNYYGDLMKEVDNLLKMIRESDKIVFFGGAGVSTESGLKDFRSQDGLYSESYRYPPEMILSHSFFLDNPSEFFRFYRDKLNTNHCKPNITHIVLKKLEDMGKVSSIITQNIDGLHQDAGSQKVIELHGSIKRNHCMKCGKFFDDTFVFGSKEIPKCECGGIIKPDVVLYEEPLDDANVLEAIKEIESCDLLIVGGTSLNVYPAAGLLRYFKGKNLVLINKDRTPFDNQCDLVIYDKLGNVFRTIEKEIC